MKIIIFILFLAIEFCAKAQIISGNATSIQGIYVPRPTVDKTNLTYNIGTPGTYSWTAGGGGGSGTVTSVSLTAPSSLLNVSGSPITSSGTIGLTLANFSANTLFGNPTGSSTTPTTIGLGSGLGFSTGNLTNTGVLTFNGRGGNITPQAGDYSSFYLQNITGYFTSGTGYTLNGSGTLVSPYSLNITGGGSSTLAGLSDVSLGTKYDGDNFIFSQSINKWTNTGGFKKVFNVRDYGAKCDFKIVYDATMLATSTTLTSATANFTAGDVGKIIIVHKAGTGGRDLKTTIASFTNSTTITLTASSVGAVSSVWTYYGTDDTSPIQSAINAAQAWGSGQIYFPSLCIVDGPLLTAVVYNGNTYNPNSQLYIPYSYFTTTDRAAIEFVADNPPNYVTGIQATDNGPSFKGGGIVSTLSSGSISSGVTPSVIASLKGSAGTFFNYNFTTFTNMNFFVRSNPNGNGPESGVLNMQYCASTTIRDNNISIDGSLFSSVMPVGKYPAVVMPTTNCETEMIISGGQIEGFYAAVVPGEHTKLSNFSVICCAKGIWFSGTTPNFPITGDKITLSNCVDALYCTSSGNVSVDFQMLDIQVDQTGKWYSTNNSPAGNCIKDSLNTLYSPKPIPYSVTIAGTGQSNAAFSITGGKNLYVTPSDNRKIFSNYYNATDAFQAGQTMLFIPPPVNSLTANAATILPIYGNATTTGSLIGILGFANLANTSGNFHSVRIAATNNGAANTGKGFLEALSAGTNVSCASWDATNGFVIKQDNFLSVTDGATITLDWSVANNYTWTTSRSTATLANTNITLGQKKTLKVVLNATSLTLTLPSFSQAIDAKGNSISTNTVTLTGTSGDVFTIDMQCVYQPAGSVFAHVYNWGHTQSTWADYTTSNTFTGTTNTFNNTVTAGNFYTTSSAPSISAGVGAGTGPTITWNTGATNKGGVLNVTTGTSPTAASTIATLTFSGSFAYPNAPQVTITPANSATAAAFNTLSTWGSGTTTTAVISGTLGASTSYSFNVFVGQ